MTDTTTNRLALIDGGSLYYEMAGSDDAVLFLHGFTLDTRMWDDQWDRFASDYRVIRLDFRGFGQSSDPLGGWDAGAHKHDVEALLVDLGIERAHIVGLSMGGAIAQDFALTYPHRVRSLVLLDSDIPGFPRTPPPGGAPAPPQPPAGSDPFAAFMAGWRANPMMASGFAHPVAGPKLDLITGAYRGTHLTSPAVPPTGPTAFDRLEAINAPTLVVVGELDVPSLHERWEALRSRIPGAESQVIPAAGHMCNMENPVAVNATLADWLARH